MPLLTQLCQNNRRIFLSEPLNRLRCTSHCGLLQSLHTVKIPWYSTQPKSIDYLIKNRALNRWVRFFPCCHRNVLFWMLNNSRRKNLASPWHKFKSYVRWLNQWKMLHLIIGYLRKLIRWHPPATHALVPSCGTASRSSLSPLRYWLFYLHHTHSTVSEYFFV